MHSEKDHDWENLEWNGTQEDLDPARYDHWREWLLLGSGVTLVALQLWLVFR